ncbi:MAG: AAA family ATPase [Scytolyngbya sp. HA4215-MV1]|jgi:PAS domain S-box-containing protein|nr:AAA family ATPase [Scytolyngbya sp. HA4215-MV1]
MVAIPGYQVFEKLCESSRSLIYRAQRDSDQKPLLLKILRQEYPSRSTVARFQTEYDILRSLNLEGVIKAYALETYQQSPVLVLEDFGGTSLQAWLHDYPEGKTASHPTFNLEEFLTLAIQVTSTLGEIHQHHIIHKDINPSNIVLNPVTGQVKIIDFGIATVLPQENATFRNPDVLEGTLAYMSPEQTGRMNRAVDYRTDFYSLGVTFYQVLCDRLPFDATDPLELVHCHIAKQPTPPHVINPAIPPPISDLVMKLLAKNAEDRYQSTHGIRADLQDCLNQLQQTQQIEPFLVGRWDICSTFQIPQKLYGREQEVADLWAAFHRVTRHSSLISHSDDTAQKNNKCAELILVSGSPGIGKTALVQELYKPVTQQQGYFITGKYEQLQCNIPYLALIQAFRELIQQLLSESEEQVAIWREKLLAALGDNAQVVIDLIPDIELLVGKQPAAIELPPAETQNRFHLILETFIRVFTQPAGMNGVEQPHPLIIFLDDLQWADKASLQLIQRWMTALNDQHLLVIGAYRDQEVNAAHPLTQLLNDIQTAGGTVHRIVLPTLELAEIDRLIQDTFHCKPERSLPLAELTLQKTDGNPFFINEFLRFLYQHKLVDLNIQQGTWQWDLQRIQTAKLPSNVVELVVDRIQNLPVLSQRVLSFAACAGNQFDLKMLAVVSGQLPLETATHLKPAIQQSLIAPIEEDYQYLESYPQFSEIASNITYKFLHDRIQQAVYSLIPEHDKTQYHLKIGRFLLEVTSKELLEDRIFDIVDHLNIGLQLITEQPQKNELARFNLIAGQKAQTAIAYEAALNYLNIGRFLLSEDSWQTAYELTLALCESTAKAAYLAGDFEQMEQRVDEVLHHAQTALEKTKVYLVKIQACIAQDQFMQAIQIALQALELLGIQLPAQPNPERIAQGLSETKQIVAEKQIEDLVQLPRMTNPYQLAAMQMIASVCTPTYFLAPELWKLMVFQKMQISIHYGNAPGSAFGYADYGMIQCAIEENIDAAYQFAQLAITLQSQLNAKEFIPKTALLVNMYLKHWREHLKETLHPLLEAYQCGLETGDLEYATFAIAFRFYHSYLIGRELTQLEQEMASYEGTIAQFRQVLPLNLTRIYRQAVLNLIEESNHPGQLLGNCYNEDERLPQLIAANDKYLLFHLYLNKLILAYLFQNTKQAAEYSTTAAQLLSDGAVGLLVVPVFYSYDSLARIAVFPQVSPAEQQQILQTIEANQQKMQHWADHAPMNYLHKFYLVAAERARILGQDAEAADAYDLAIDLAQTHEYLNEEALANELAGRFYLAKGKLKIARTYLWDARYGYLRWGATAKVRDLDQRYPEMFDRLPERTSTTTRSQHSFPTTSSTTETVALDLAALMKASQALSDEIVLDKLLAKLMVILLENAGAQRGCLLLEHDGRLQIEAESNVESNSPSVSQVPVTSAAARERLSLAIVHYVARTQESIVLNRADHDYRFNQDAYILKYQPKSILCTPLIHQGKLTGILYLENNLTLDAFTPERLKILQFLSTQAAISIDNARLYSQLEQRVQERTAELTQTNDRLQTEILERQRSEQTLRMIVEGTASVIGVDFFRSLVRSLAQTLNVRYAFISECMDAIPTRVRSFAFWQGDEFGDEFEYDLHGTPCERIINSKGSQCFPDQIQSRFPEDQDLKDMQAQSYAGIALLGSTGNLLGHLAVLDDQPLENESRTQAVLEIFAARAAAEMERKQAEDALRVSETKFSTAFRSSPDAITISTLKDGCYIEVNHSCLRMLGYCHEEMIGHSALELGVWATPEERDTVKQRLQQQGSITNLETRLRRKSGEIFPALFSAEVIHLENEPCLLAVAADITMLKQAEKALERLAEIGELAAMIVHEVRNPLTTISMGLNSFKKLQLSDRFQEYLSLSLDEADRLQRLLNQILLYSRPQTLQRSSLELNSFISDVLNTLKTIPAAMGKHLHLVAVTKPVKVLADSDKLKQVVINLVTNACEAVDAGETITVRIQEIESNHICIQIHNGGVPIPAEVLPNLTKPFFTTKASGTGLGLAIVKRIIEAHDGEFRIESSAASGTTVSVQLLLAPQPSQD